MSEDAFSLDSLPDGELRSGRCWCCGEDFTSMTKVLADGRHLKRCLCPACVLLPFASLHFGPMFGVLTVGDRVTADPEYDKPEEAKDA